MRRSHGRSSDPLDKPVPVWSCRAMRAAARRTYRRLHHAKQRQRNRALVAAGRGGYARRFPEVARVVLWCADCGEDCAATDLNWAQACPACALWWLENPPPAG